MMKMRKRIVSLPVVVYNIVNSVTIGSIENKRKSKKIGKNQG